MWDYIAVYPRGAVWEGSPPEPLYADGLVVRVIDEALSDLSRALKGVKLKTLALNKGRMYVKTAIRNGISSALRQLLAEDSLRG